MAEVQNVRLRRVVFGRGLHRELFDALHGVLTAIARAASLAWLLVQAVKRKQSCLWCSTLVVLTAVCFPAVSTGFKLAGRSVVLYTWCTDCGCFLG
jgi:hypothetical protein